MKKTLIIILTIAAVTACATQTPEQPDSQPAIDSSHPTIESTFDPDITSWTLESGTPPSADPEPLIYTGTAVLQGWIVYEPYYVSGDVAHFKLTAESTEKLPEEIQDRQTFILLTRDGIDKYKWASTNIINELETYGIENPATIGVDEIQIQMEGSPFLNLVEIVK